MTDLLFRIRNPEVIAGAIIRTDIPDDNPPGT
jgi:hypothetical protein